MKQNLLLLLCTSSIAWVRCGKDVDVSWICPNQCSGHGICSDSTAGQCECYLGFIGVDCSQRTCPANKAWVDIPMEDNIAHRPYTECSNMGTCDRQTGLCKCREGFTGPACDILACPTGNTAIATFTYSSDIKTCSGNGRCLSLRQLSLYTDYVNYFDVPKVEYSDWDADRIYGCVCDEGWTGPSCDLRTCPLGDDPLTGGEDEVQVIDCLCTTCAGGVYLSIHNEQTPLIPYDAPAALIKYYLERFTSIEAVDVVFETGTQLCSPLGSVTSITFKAPARRWGKLSILKTSSLHVNPALFAVKVNGHRSKINLQAISRQQTKEIAECSNRGTCNRQTGSCDCFEGYGSSDGRGGQGQKGDCSYLKSGTALIPHSFNNTQFITTCPVANGLICGGHGICEEQFGLCRCDEGYGGLNCSWKLCPVSTAWYGLVGGNHSQQLECSGIGTCDYQTGTCHNCGGGSVLNTVFSGEACQYLTCPSSGDHQLCGGNGACLTLRQLANFAWNEKKELTPVSYTTPWDADMIRGCVCDRAVSVDNQFYSDYQTLIGDRYFNVTNNNNNYTLDYFSEAYLQKFYRGPYAFTATDFKGYNCLLKRCPTGDSPLYNDGVNEIQAFRCSSSTNGWFTLTFRQNTSLPIRANGTLAHLQYRLQQLFTIGEVKVYKEASDGTTTICSPTGTSMNYIEFLTEFGSLPMLSLTPLSDLSDHFLYRYQRGTKFDLECSGMGLCREETGICQCMKGFQSSDGSRLNPGERGDCTYFNRFYTATTAREPSSHSSSVAKRVIVYRSD